METSRRLVRPASANSVDEMCVLFKGWTRLAYRLRNKPVSHGYKILALITQGGITLAVQPLSPEEEVVFDCPEDIPDCLDPTSSAVFDLWTSARLHYDGDDRKDSSALHGQSVHEEVTVPRAPRDQCRSVRHCPHAR